MPGPNSIPRGPFTSHLRGPLCPPRASTPTPGPAMSVALRVSADRARNASLCVPLSPRARVLCHMGPWRQWLPANLLCGSRATYWWGRPAGPSPSPNRDIGGTKTWGCWVPLTVVACSGRTSLLPINDAQGRIHLLHPPRPHLFCLVEPRHHHRSERGDCRHGRALLLLSTCPSCVWDEFVVGQRIGHRDQLGARSPGLR
jgi:hypothetical protein